MASTSAPKASSPAPEAPVTSSAADPILATESVEPATDIIEAAESDNDYDSTYGSDRESSTASLTSSVRAHRTILGRQFHAERGTGNYWGANDERHIDTMEIWHYHTYLVLGSKLFLAPLDKSTLKSALDIGTGLGDWAIDFADAFPDCEIIGTDISPIQRSWVPPNLRFEIEDCTEPWTFGDNRFDYVHMGLLYGSIPDWKALFAKAYRACKPGGWIESLETSGIAYCDDDTLDPQGPFKKWGDVFVNYGIETGFTFRVIEDNHQIEALKDLGFKDKDITIKEFKSPTNGWAKDKRMKELGEFALHVTGSDIEGFLTQPASRLGWTKPEVLLFASEFRTALRDPKIHAYWKYRAVWVQKPLDAN